MIEAGTIQSARPARVERPQTLQEYGEAVRRCSDGGEKIVDYGVAHQGLGHAPLADHVRVEAPSDTFEHWRADLSVRAAGGMTIGELQRRLGETHQFLPVDADEDMTVAEVIAHNVSGPLRLTHGTCRDLLLGLRYIDAMGTLITVGGRTVKNVAGYDVTRLMVGNLNTLGLIADANLRTAAIPQQVTRIEAVGIDPAGLDAAMTDLLTSDAAPWYMHFHGGILTTGYCGTPKGCEAQCTAFQRWLQDRKLDAASVHQIDADLVGDTTARAESRDWRRRVAGHLRLIVPPDQTGSVIKRIAEWKPIVEQVDALPPHGVIDIGGQWSVDDACRVDSQAGELLQSMESLRVWHRRPDDTHRLAPFAPPQSDWAMLNRIKQAMDPGNLFNPGRFP